MNVLQLRGRIADDGAAPLALAALAAEARAALAALGEAVGPEQRERVEELERAVARHAPRVVLVGQVKAGKTALVNALAGLPDLLPTDVNPATSAITSLHLNQPWRDPRASFAFFDHEDWAALTLGGGRLGQLARRAGREEEARELERQVGEMRERAQARLGGRFEKLVGGRHNFDRVDAALLRRYVCVGDEEEDARSGRFAELTRDASAAVEAPGWPAALTLIDTPGVNDPFLVREQMTLRALADSDLCVVVLSAHQAMTTVDLALLRMLAGVREGRSLVFVNRVDELSDPDAQVPEIGARLRDTLRRAGLAEEAGIVFGSAAARPDGPRSWGVAGLRARIEAALTSGLAARPLADALGEGLALCRQARARARVAVASMDEADLAARVDPILARSHRALDVEIERGWIELRSELLRITEAFTEAECARLEAALRSGGRIGAWSVDTAALRWSMKGAYGEFAASVSERIDAVLARMADGLAAVYGELLGEEAGALEAPRAPVVPAPVPFARTMTVDADLGWWRRLLGGGVRGRVEELREAIRTESLALVTEFGAAQVPQLSREASRVAAGFFDDHADTLFEIAASGDGSVPHDLLARSGIEGASAGRASRLASAEARLSALESRLVADGPSA